MKNYILLGIGIGMIISGIMFSMFENKEHKELELIIRKELLEELEKERVFTSFEKELEEMFYKESKFEQNEVNEVVEELKNTNTIDFKSKVEKEENEILFETEKSNMTNLAMEKFKPLKDEINDHSIQFRSSSNMDEVIRVQNMLNDTIDTKIEFIQGFYRLFANELYSKEYSEIIAHEIKNEFNLNPVIRNQKQLDYLILGPRRYAEKYEKQETVINKETLEQNIVTNIEDKNLSNKEEKHIQNNEDNNIIDKTKNINKENTTLNKEITFKLVFIKDGTYEESNEVAEKIKDLMELEIRENQEKYTVISKEAFNENISKDLASKLKLLFDLNVTLSKEK